MVKPTAPAAHPSLESVKATLAALIAADPTLADEMIDLSAQVVREHDAPALRVENRRDFDGEPVKAYVWFTPDHVVELDVHDTVAAMSPADVDALTDGSPAAQQLWLDHVARTPGLTFDPSTPYEVRVALPEAEPVVVCPVCGADDPDVRDVTVEIAWHPITFDHDDKVGHIKEANGDGETAAFVAECCGASVKPARRLRVRVVTAPTPPA